MVSLGFVATLALALEPLERSGVLGLVEKAKLAASEQTLAHDQPLSHAAMCLAEHVLNGLPLTALQTRKCAARARVFDNLLLPLSVVDSSEEAFLEHAARHIRSEGQKRRANVYGAAVLEQSGLRSYVLLLSERRGALHVDREPREPGDRVVFHGGLALDYSRPRAVMTTPFGEVREVPLDLVSSREFSGHAVLPKERGRYQLEIIGFHDQTGPVVVANQALYVGVPPSAVSLTVPSARDAVPVPPVERLLERMNQVRVANGFAPLLLDRALCRAAQRHAEDMNRRNYFGHDSPEATPVMRLRSAKIEFTRAAENIAEASSPDDAHETLMDSPGHRKNVVDRSLERVGIGVVESRLSTGAPRFLVVIDFVQ